MPPAYRTSLRLLRMGLRLRLDAAEVLDTARARPIMVRTLFVAATRHHFGAARRLGDIAAFAAAMYVETPRPELGRRGFEAVLRGALGEPYLSAHLMESAADHDAYLDAAIAITARILGQHRNEPGSEVAIFRDAVDLHDELSSSPSADSSYQYRATPTWADEPRWAIDGQRPRTVAGAWLKALSLRRKDEQDALRRQTEWRAGELDFLSAAFVYAMRAHFSPLVDLRDTTDFAVEIIQRFELQKLPLIDIEALVRWAIKDEFASIDDISGHDRFTVYGLGAGLVIWKLQAPPEAVDTLVAHAETVASEHGWEPVFS